MLILAIIVGVLIARVGSTLAGFVYGLGFAAVFTAGSGMTQAEAQESLRAMILTKAFLVPALLINVGFTLLGGYVAARIGGRDTFVVACFVGVFVTVVQLLLPQTGIPWVDLTNLLSLFPAALIGGYLAASKPSRGE